MSAARIVYRSAAVLVIAWAIVRVTGLGTSGWTPAALLYYTVLSNILCLVWLAVSLGTSIAGGSEARRASPSPRFAAAVMMAITVTMLIYLVVLVPSAFSQPGTYEPFTLTDTLVHIVTPLLVIVDWLVFVPHGRLRRYDPLLWPLIPYAYLVFAFVYGASGGTFQDGSPYPYPFMDADALGWAGVALWIAGLTVSLVAVAFVWLGADRLLRRFATRSAALVTSGADDAV